MAVLKKCLETQYHSQPADGVCGGAAGGTTVEDNRFQCAVKRTNHVTV